MAIAGKASEYFRVRVRAAFLTFLVPCASFAFDAGFRVQETLKPAAVALKGTTVRYSIQLRAPERSRLVAVASTADSLGPWKVLRVGEFRGTFREGGKSGEEVGFQFDLEATGVGWLEVPWPPITLEVPGVGGKAFPVPPRPRLLVLPKSVPSTAVALAGMLAVFGMGLRLKKKREARERAEEIDRNQKREQRLRQRQ